MSEARVAGVKLVKLRLCTSASRTRSVFRISAIGTRCAGDSRLVGTCADYSDRRRSTTKAMPSASIIGTSKSRPFAPACAAGAQREDRRQRLHPGDALAHHPALLVKRGDHRISTAARGLGRDLGREERAARSAASALYSTLPPRGTRPHENDARHTRAPRPDDSLSTRWRTRARPQPCSGRGDSLPRSIPDLIQARRPGRPFVASSAKVKHPDASIRVVRGCTTPIVRRRTIQVVRPGTTHAPLHPPASWFMVSATPNDRNIRSTGDPGRSRSTGLRLPFSDRVAAPYSNARRRGDLTRG